jgi:hypothetical protein
MNLSKIAIPVISIIVVFLLIFIFYSDYFEGEKTYNEKPTVKIEYPFDGDKVSKILTISGIATDPNGNQTIKKVELLINETWFEVEGTNQWSFTWNIFDLEDGLYIISARAWDGAVYSNIDEVEIEILNPKAVESGCHKWAVFIIAANFPEDEEFKLGNGGLYLAEEMASYFIENLNYPTSNIYILFDDGWYRDDFGIGEKIQTLQQRYHEYDITYSEATKEVVISTFEHVINESNMFEDSEVFIWVSSHGCGNNDNVLTGGKLFEQSAFFLWDEEIVTDKELSEMLANLESSKTNVIVDACYSGGFADKTILSFPEFIVFKSGLAKSGRVIISGASKFRVGYASVQSGPLFTQLWFQGLKTGDADGFRPGYRDSGRPTLLKMFKDDKVSVEEAFYYARYVLKNTEELKEYNNMEPQINDQYPCRIIRSEGLILGE